MKEKIKINNNQIKSIFQVFYVIFENTKLADTFCNLKDFKNSKALIKKNELVFFHVSFYTFVETGDESLLNAFNDKLNKIKTAIKKIDPIATIFAINKNDTGLMKNKL
jgi:hypothetical protein